LSRRQAGEDDAGSGGRDAQVEQDMKGPERSGAQLQLSREYEASMRAHREALDERVTWASRWLWTTGLGRSRSHCRHRAATGTGAQREEAAKLKATEAAEQDAMDSQRRIIALEDSQAGVARQRGNG